MNREEKKLVAIGARVEGDAAVARRLGDKVEVSEMELIILTSMAYYGAISVLVESEVSDIHEAQELKAELQEAIESKFGHKGELGMGKVVQTVVGMVTQERLGQYLVTNH